MDSVENLQGSLERICAAITAQGSTVGRHDQALTTQGQQIQEILQTVHALSDQLNPVPPVSVPEPVDAPNVFPSALSFQPPERFDGSSDACQGFLMQCSVYMKYHPLLRSDSERIHFLISLLTGKARRWATALWTADSPLLTSYEQFCHQIAVVFDHPAAGRDVGSRLVFLASRTAADYALDFRTLAAGSGWSDPALLTVYRLGLSSQL
ncbi:protein LDOC1-like [Xyrauchen texanus]|uniref:protein LDOC1-like n=1 Tax=Xyrauchen texanus TaxID=154827 RepID=UPI0022426E00|nr:protein LDOC1-like [Xyrauchen texanus]